MSDPIYITTPPGRLLQGDAFKPNTKDQLGNPLTDRSGQPTVNYFIGVGIPKGPEFDALWSQVQAKAALDFPGGESLQPGFRWKVEDGDSEKFAGREGFAGHWIWKMQSNFPPDVVDAQAVPQAVGPEGCKKGFYVRVQLSVKGNGLAGGANAGVYMNASVIQVIGFGPVLSSGPDMATIFAAPYVLPPGASVTPLAPTAPLVVPAVPSVAVAPVAAPVAPAVPDVPVASPAVPGVAVAPVAAPVAPAVPGVPPTVPAVPGVAVAPAPAVPGVPPTVPAVPGVAVAPAPAFLQTPGAPR